MQATTQQHVLSARFAGKCCGDGEGKRDDVDGGPVRRPATTFCRGARVRPPLPYGLKATAGNAGQTAGKSGGACALRSWSEGEHTVVRALKGALALRDESVPGCLDKVPCSRRDGGKVRPRGIWPTARRTNVK